MTNAGLAVLAIVTLVLTVYVLGRDPGPTGQSLSAERSTGVGRSPSSPASTTDVDDVGDPPLSVLVLGDESVQGARTAGRWIRELREVGDVVNRSRPLSGYLTEGPAEACGLPACPSLTTMLDLAVRAAEKPDIVLVSAGSHDVMTERAVLRQGISSFFTTLRSGFPDARIVVIAPVVREGEPPAGLDVVTRAVQAAAERVDADLVDIGQPYLDSQGDSPGERIARAGEALRSAVDAVLTP